MLLADELNARGVGAIAREERVRAFEQLHLPLSASLTQATVIKVGQLVGASEVIVGAYVARRWHAQGRPRTASAIDVGRLQPEVTEQAPLADLFGLFDRLAPAARAGRGRCAAAIRVRRSTRSRTTSRA